MSSWQRFKTSFLKNEFLLIFLTALCLRALAGCLIISTGDDIGEGIREAEEILAGNGLVTSMLPEPQAFRNVHPPIFPYSLAASFKLFGHSLEPLRGIYILIAALACLLLADIGKRTMGRAGTLAGWVLALYPAQIFWSSRVNPFNLMYSLIVLGMWLALTYSERPRTWLAALMGLLWASFALMRTEYFLGSACIVFFLLWKHRFRCKNAAVFVICLMIGMSPWIARNYAIHKRIIILNLSGSDVLWNTFHADYHFDGERKPFTPELYAAMAPVSEMQRNDILFADIKRYVKTHPWRALYIAIGNLVHFWRPYLAPNAAVVSVTKNLVYTLSYVPIFVFFLLGLRLAPWRDPFWVFVLTFILYKALVHWVGYAVVHFREAIVPLMIPIAVLGVIDTWETVSTMKNREA